MSALELRRLLLVLLPALAAIGIVAAVVATKLSSGDEGLGGQNEEQSPERDTIGAPRIGVDHWHASYEAYICGELQPNAPEWRSGVHTHSDGIIHIHPFVPFEEGSGARLVKWFEYGGGRLTENEMRMPGSRDIYRNGDRCPDGREGALQLFVNDEPGEDWGRYIPQDGDRIRIVFGPEED